MYLTSEMELTRQGREEINADGLLCSLDKSSVELSLYYCTN